MTECLLCDPDWALHKFPPPFRQLEVKLSGEIEQLKARPPRSPLLAEHLYDLWRRTKRKLGG